MLLLEHWFNKTNTCTCKYVNMSLIVLYAFWETKEIVLLLGLKRQFLKLPVGSVLTAFFTF